MVKTHAHSQGCGGAPHLFHPVRGHTHAHAVTDVEAQRLVGAVFVELHPPVCLREDVHVDDGGDLSEVVRQANQESAFALWVDGGAAGPKARPAQHLLPPLKGVGGADQRFFP